MQDNRAHRTLLDDEKVEWLTDIKREDVPILNALLEEASEFMDDHLESWCKRHLKLSTAVGGKRTDRTAQVAMHDEKMQSNPDSVASKPRS